MKTGAAEFFLFAPSRLAYDPSLDPSTLMQDTVPPFERPAACKSGLIIQTDNYPAPRDPINVTGWCAREGCCWVQTVAGQCDGQR